MYKCSYCDKHYDNLRSLKNHEGHCPKNEHAYHAWNKGLTKLDDPRLEAHGRVVSSALKGRQGHAHTEAEKENLRSKALANKSGGYIRGSGRGRKGWYKGFWCDSSWELAYVIYCLEHDIYIKRCKEKRTYIYQEKTYRYYPDFEVDGQIIEIKGWESEQTKIKRETNPDVLFLFEEDLKYVFDYVHSKYGKDFIKLYEKEA